MRRMTQLGVFRHREKRLVELDARIDALLQSEFGMANTEELVRAAGASVFGSDGAELPTELRVMDAGEFLERVRVRQQDCEEFAQALTRLKAKLREREEALADTENASQDKKTRSRLQGETIGLRQEIREYELMRKCARMELWQLSREEDIRVVDMDVARARLDALVERRLQLALQLRVAEAQRICAERSTRRGDARTSA